MWSTCAAPSSYPRITRQASLSRSQVVLLLLCASLAAAPEPAWALVRKRAYGRAELKALIKYDLSTLGGPLETCMCVNTSQSISLKTSRWAVGNQMRRSQLLSAYIHWEDMVDDPAHDAPPPPESNIMGSPSKDLSDMVGCLREKYTPQEVLWENTITRNVTQGQFLPTNIRVAGAFWTEHRLPAVSFMYEEVAAEEQQTRELPITLVTTGTLDRLPQLIAQCQTWPGPMTVALLLALVQEDVGGPLTVDNAARMRQAVIQIAKFVADMAKTYGACQPDVILAYEVYPEPDSKLLFPINILRNYARLQARTPLVALLDVDLVLSRSMQIRMFNVKKANDLIKSAKAKTVYIIPAFDVVGDFERPAWADALVAGNKDTMVLAIERGWVMQFHGKRFAAGHRLTNYTRWAVANSDYMVPFERNCEPWFVGDRVAMPWHDERFRGFGLNKMQHLANLFMQKFRFRVLHDVFTIHRPHKHGEAKKMYHQTGAGGREGMPSLHTHNMEMYRQQYNAMEAGTYEAYVSDPVANCKAKLSWWQQQQSGQA